MFSTGKQDENADYEHVAMCLSAYTDLINILFMSSEVKLNKSLRSPLGHYISSVWSHVRFLHLTHTKASAPSALFPTLVCRDLRDVWLDSCEVSSFCGRLYVIKFLLGM